MRKAWTFGVKSINDEIVLVFYLHRTNEKLKGSYSLGDQNGDGIVTAGDAFDARYIDSVAVGFKQGEKELSVVGKLVFKDNGACRI